MKEKTYKIGLIAESLAAVHTHTHTHTCSFKGLTNNAIFAFINNGNKDENSRNGIARLLCMFEKIKKV